MQLKPTSPLGRPLLRSQLIAASCGLLGSATALADNSGNTTVVDPAVSEIDPIRTLDTAIDYYKENDGRISAIEPVVSVHAHMPDDQSYNLKLTIDSLSGATPNGAIIATTPQVFTSPSGHSLSNSGNVPVTITSASGGSLGTQSDTSTSSIYYVNPGIRPMYAGYKNTRLALAGSWGFPVAPDVRSTVGGNLSFEHDFLSLSGNGEVEKDLNNKNTTLSAGLNLELDQVRPIGGTPVAGSDYSLFQRTSNKSKRDFNLILGATQVMNQRWIAEANLSYDRLNGYLNDPYKIISIIDAGGNEQGYINEKRPAQRQRTSAYLENRVATDWTMTALSLRYMTDNWGVHSETAELRWRFWVPPSRRWYLEPQLRWYKQTAASFYTPWIVNTGQKYVTDASSDERLGAMHTLSYGLKYAVQIPNSNGLDPTELSIRAVYYVQTADHAEAAPGVLAGYNMFPGLKSFALHMEWKFDY